MASSPRLLPLKEDDSADNRKPEAKTPEDKSSAGSVQQDEKKVHNLSLDQKKQIRSELDLDGKIGDEKLEAENWDLQFLDATQAKLKELARQTQVNTNGSKLDILNRILDWYSGVN